MVNNLDLAVDVSESPRRRLLLEHIEPAFAGGDLDRLRGVTRLPTHQAPINAKVDELILVVNYGNIELDDGSVGRKRGDRFLITPFAKGGDRDAGTLPILDREAPLVLVENTTETEQVALENLHGNHDVPAQFRKHLGGMTIAEILERKYPQGLGSRKPVVSFDLQRVVKVVALTDIPVE